MNAGAQAQRAADELNGDIDRNGLETLKGQLREAVKYSRIDARLFSFLGEISRRLDGPDSGAPLFDHAYKLSRTDILTLYQMLARSVEQGKPVEAVRYLDVLLRRWPDRFEQVAALIPALLAEPEGYDAILENLGSDPPWRGRLIHSLARNAATVPMAGKVLLDLQGQSPLPSSEVSATINGYIAQGNYAEAYQLFLFTLTDEEQQLEGYVFNEHFAPISTRRPFDWQYRAQPGVEIRMPSDMREQQDRGAVVRFLNKPVKTVTLQQYLHLPPGRYTLSLEASASNLKLPKDLYWTLSCAKPVVGLGRLPISEGTYRHSVLETSFVVEPGACPLQLLRMESGLVAESWRYRYSGTLTMHRLHIERMQP